MCLYIHIYIYIFAQFTSLNLFSLSFSSESSYFTPYFCDSSPAQFALRLQCAAASKLKNLDTFIKYENQ